MEKDAKMIIQRDIDHFAINFMGRGADAALHIVIGKIKLAVQLGLIGYTEMDAYIDLLFVEHERAKK